jgi:hypothetical protein
MLVSIAYVANSSKETHQPDCLLHRFQILEICNIVTVLFLVLCRAGLRGGPAGELPSVPVYKGHRKVTGLIIGVVLVNSGFHKQKNFSENYPQFGHALKDVRQASRRPKNFKQYQFERAPNY